ncbi:MAG: RNA polymerase sigma factor [Oscillospiraceae bacterium]|nr:RNA polymerase sigma factor [Oscillospiraceae bacterium]
MEDERIIDLYFDRDESAISETKMKYGAYLTTVAYNILRSNEDSEEVVLDTYLGAWNAMPPEKPSLLRVFLARITRNLSFKRVEYASAKKREHSDAVLDELEECITPDLTALEVEARELSRALNGYLESLSNFDCAVFLARYYYCLTNAEIGEKYGVSERRVKYLLSKMRQKLKVKLGEEGFAV